jgi:hypothetical protein
VAIGHLITYTNKTGAAISEDFSANAFHFQETSHTTSEILPSLGRSLFRVSSQASRNGANLGDMPKYSPMTGGVT